MFTELTDIKSKNGQEKTVSITFNALIPNNDQIFVTEHNRHNNRNNRISVQILVKNDYSNSLKIFLSSCSSSSTI